MPTRTKSEFFRFSGVDALLAVLGLVGYACFAVFISPLHTDSSAEYVLSESEAIEAAQQVLSENGYGPDNLIVTARLERDVEVLKDVQRMLGRREAVKFLSSPISEPVRGYHWRVQFSERQESEDNGSMFTRLRPIFTVELSQSGNLLAFERGQGSQPFDASNRRSADENRAVVRDAIAHALASSSYLPDSVRAQLNTIPDSTLRSRLVFDMSGRGSGVSALQSPEGIAVVDSAGVMRLARYHLSRSALSSLAWTPDTSSITYASGTRRTRIDMVADTPLAGQKISAELGMSVTGVLTDMAVTYTPQIPEATTTNTALTFIRVGVYGVLVIIFIVLFFRRMVARLIDFKSAGIDALIFGVAFGSIWLLSRQGMYEGLYWPTWAMALLRLVVFSFVGVFTSLFVFILSGVTDSLSRDRFPSKVRTLMLLRHGQLQNASFGSGLLRGVLTGGILLGIVTLALWVFDGAIPVQLQFMLSDAMYQPVAGDLLGGFSVSYMNALILAMGFGLVAFGSSGRGWIVVPSVALGALLMQLAPASLVMTWEGMVVNILVGLVLGLAFLKWDLVTIIVALFSSTLIWSQKEGLLIAGAESWVDGLLAILFLISLVIFAIVGIVSGEESRSVKEYVPEYVTEMAGQERVKRELEIAYQVQASFLPRSMPRIRTLDLAGMCLPANEVGGDYYDYIELDERHLAVVIGDVSGKGIHASFFMTLVKGILQSAARASRSPAEVLRQLNHLFYINVPSGTFITLIYGVLDIQTGTFTFVRAGHNPAILLRGESPEYTFLQPPGMAVGFVDHGMFDHGLEEQVIHLDPGDMVVLYTDGFSEAMNIKRDLYGDERLAEKAAHFGAVRSASAMLRLLTEDVHHFIEGMGRTDDMTMMVIKRKAET